MQPTYQNYDYTDDSLSQYEKRGNDKLNLTEVVLILLVIILLIGSFIFGIFTQGTSNRDKQRSNDISQVLIAIESYYQNSDTNPSQRTYPIAVCSSQLNEVDYEYSLAEYLTGNRQVQEPHKYILASDFPTDKSGVYNQNFESRGVKVRDCPKIFPVSNQKGQIYSDGRKSCNFKRNENQYKFCYLYTSSTSGDEFQLGYFSESKNAFAVYSKFRDGKLKLEYLAN
jgi:type II secretory pathway pseudopilin PulG